MSSDSTPLLDAGVNPIKTDLELQTLVKKLDSIKKYKRFQKWKEAFLNRLEQFLYEEGMTPAQKACNDFDDLLKKFVKMANKCQGFIENGELSNERKTVKASLGLSEMCSTLTTVNEEIENLIPSTARDERKRGFTKFHLGAVLIRQGFHQYVTMNVIKDAIAHVQSNIPEVMDKQQHELFKAYQTQLERFCDVMADLNLYEIMLKCIQFLEEPEDESEDPEPVEVTIKTHDNRSFKIIFEFNENVLNIKQAIQSHGYEVPVDRQILSFRGIPLQDDKQTVEEAKLEDGSTLLVEPEKIAIKVVSDGKENEVMVDPTSSILQIKQQLASVCGMEPDNQHLSMNGIEIGDDGQSADFYGIKSGSVLHLEPKTIKISVAMPGGKSLELEVDPTKDTTCSIKKMIEEKAGIVAHRQILFAGDETLQDGTRLKDIGLTNGAELTLEFKTVPVEVNVYDGRKLKVMVDPFDTLASFKSILEQESGLNAENQHISMNGVEIVGDGGNTASFYGIVEGCKVDLKPQSILVTVNMPNGSSHSIEVQPTEDNLISLKEKIRAVSGMDTQRQVVLLEGTQLTDNVQSAFQLGLRQGTALDVEVFTIPITVRKMDGTTVEVSIDPMASLATLKKCLEEKCGLPASNQNLSFDGNLLSEDDKTASDYGIQAGSILDIEPKTLPVTINMPDGSVLAIDLRPSDSIDDIKQRIEAKSGVAVPRQVVQFNGELLKRGTARDMGIKDGSSLDVSIFTIPVTVRTSNGNSFQVMVDPLDKLMSIKKGLEAQSGIAASNQNLNLEGKVLEGDDMTAANHGITEGSTLHLEPKNMQIHARMPDGNTFQIVVTPSDTSDVVKSRIEDASGMKSTRQILNYDGKELRCPATFREYEIEDGETIDVAVLKFSVKVQTMDGTDFTVQVEPEDSLGSLKKLLAKESGVPANNQNLFYKKEALLDDNQSAKCAGLKPGCVVDMEPKTIGLKIQMPSGEFRTVQVKPSDSSNEIKAEIAAESGLEAHRQVLSFEDGKKIPSDGRASAKDMGLREGSCLLVDIHKVPISIDTHENKTLTLQVEPTDNVDSIKKFIQNETGLDPMKQCLTFEGEELNNGRRQLAECGIKAGAHLQVAPHVDPIIFLDIKSGSLFGVDRDEVIEKGALTPNQNNKRDFLEAATDSASKEKIKKAMLGSPKLGVATQVVVGKLEVEEYDLEEAEKVKSMWGVKLKKREKNKEGEELIFVDLKTGAAGELSRKKYIDMGFLTPEGEGLAEAETNTQTYDEYVAGIRQIFGVQVAT